MRFGRSISVSGEVAKWFNRPFTDYVGILFFAALILLLLALLKLLKE
jgi:hypothetical protein